MSANQEQIELFVAEATQSLRSVHRSLDVVALGNAELSSAVVGVARSIGEAATQFELTDMAKICAVVMAEVPQVTMAELLQRDLWEPLFEALQAAIDAVAVGRSPSDRAIVMAIAHLRGESTNCDRGAELETSYAELGLAEFALEEDPFASVAEVEEQEVAAAGSDWLGGAAVEEGDWFAEEAEQAFATTEDLFTDTADGLSEFGDLAIAASEEVDVEESTGELLFSDTVLFESTEPAGAEDAFGLTDLLGEEGARGEESASQEALAERTALFGADLTSEENPEPFAFDEGLVTSLTAEQFAKAESEGSLGDSVFQESSEEEVAAAAANDFADLLEGSTEGNGTEELTMVQSEESVAEDFEFSDFGDAFGEANAEIEEPAAVAAEEQATAETEATTAEAEEVSDLADLFGGSTEELTMVQSEESVAEDFEFSDFGDAFGEANA
ncbi:MAG: hypothetical protein ACUVSQ_04700, partial [Pseudanabaenaceae cyanobacterium]